MTLVYKECGGKSRSIEDEMYLGIDGKTDRILAFQRRLRGSLMEIDMVSNYSLIIVLKKLHSVKIAAVSSPKRPTSARYKFFL